MKRKNITLSILIVGVFLFINIFLDKFALGALAFPNINLKSDGKLYLLSSYSTYYYESGENRKNNIETAAKYLNNTVILDGEEFSFNRVVGERSLTRGFKEAKIIVNNRYADGVGGGVCQVSTTLYNAVLNAGLKITECHAHSLPPSYIAPSFDAMVAFNAADLRFFNDSGGATIIKTETKNGRLNVKIYGEKENVYQISRKSEIIEYVEPEPPEIIPYSLCGLENLSFDEFDECVLSHAKYGIKSVGTLIYTLNGKVVKEIKIRSDFYKPQRKIIIKKTDGISVGE